MILYLVGAHRAMENIEKITGSKIDFKISISTNKWWYIPEQSTSECIIWDN